MPRQDKEALSEKVIRRTVPVIFRNLRQRKNLFNGYTKLSKILKRL